MPDKTLDKFCINWNKYKTNSKNYDCNQSYMQRHLYEYDSSVGHSRFLEHASITLINNTNPSKPLKIDY